MRAGLNGRTEPACSLALCPQRSAANSSIPDISRGRAPPPCRLAPSPRETHEVILTLGWDILSQTLPRGGGKTTGPAGASNVELAARV